jgi:VCBS repeat-containing protein
VGNFHLVNNVWHLTYTPKANFNGTDSFTFSAYDGKTTSNTSTVTITVDAVNDAPVTQDISASTKEDTPVTITFMATDPDGDSLGSLNKSHPAHGTFSNASLVDNVWRATYTPHANFNGTDSFTYSVNDSSGALSNTSTVTITVDAVNDAPMTQDSSASTDEDSPVSIPMTASDPDGDVITSFSATHGAHGTVDNFHLINNVMHATYTPNADYNGTDSFTYTAWDGKLTSNTSTITVTVNPVNDAPSFTKGANQTVIEDAGAQTVTNWASALTRGPANENGQKLTFNVSNSNAALFSKLKQPAISADGTLTYTPAPDAYGSATVTVTLKDNGGTANGGVDISAAQQFTITVTPVNDAPVAVKDAVTTRKNTSTLIPVLKNDIDVDGDRLSITSVTAVLNGTASINGDSVNFTPKRDFIGNASFTYSISDGNGGTATATVTITVR